MRTVLELLNFAVNRRKVTRADADPSPEEQALIIHAYAKRKFGDQTNYQPGDKLPMFFGYLFVEDRERRWNVIHEVAMLWLLKEQARARARQGSEWPQGGSERSEDGTHAEPDGVIAGTPK